MSLASSQSNSETRKPAVSFTTDLVKIKIVSEPTVILTARGYAPIVNVEANDEPDARFMYISAASLSQALEPLRVGNNNRFTGLQIKVHKESADRFAKYVVEPA